MVVFVRRIHAFRSGNIGGTSRKSSWTSVLRRLDDVDRIAAQAKNKDLVLLAYAVAKAGQLDKKLLTAVMRVATRRLYEFKALELAKIAWSCATGRLNDARASGGSWCTANRAPHLSPGHENQ